MSGAIKLKVPGNNAIVLRAPSGSGIRLRSPSANAIRLRCVGSLRGPKGDNGLTPDFSIGDVDTLNPGSEATVTLTGTQFEPVLNFGIPRGADGASDAADVTNVPAGNISSTNVQAAINELDSEKQPLDSDLTAIAGLTPSNDDIIQRKAGSWTNRSMAQLATDLNLAATYQPLDGDLTAVAGLSSTGLISRTGAGTAATRTLTGPAAGISISNGDGVSGNPTLALTNDLSAVEGISGTGLSARTAADTWTTRSIAQPAAGLTVSNGDGVSGNPTLALANDLAAVEGISGTGLAARTASDTWTTRSITQPAAGVTVTNGDGVSGNPTLALANDLAALEALSSTGIAARTASDTWAQRTITGTSNEVSVSNGDGVSGNPTLSLPSALTFTGKTVTGGTFSSPTINVKDNVFTLQDDGDATKQLQFQLSGIATATTRTWTWQNANDTVVGRATTDTLTNKTLTDPLLTSITAGSVLFYSTKIDQSNSTFFWDNTNKRLGVGTSSPATKIVAAANNTAPQAPQFNETIQAAGADGTSMGILLDAYGGAGSNPQFVGRRAFGTAASPSVVNAANTPLLQFGGVGYGSTGYGSSYRAMVQFRTAESWTDSAQGAFVALYTNPNGSASLAVEGYRLGPSGQPYFPLAATTASGANAFLDNATSPANELKRSTSSVAYKKDIERLDPKYADAILAVQPIWYRSNIKTDRQDWSWYGLSAEELAAVEPRLVHWGYKEDDFETITDEESQSSWRELKKGAQMSPDGVMYDRLTVMLLDVVRRLTDKVAELEAKVS